MSEFKLVRSGGHFTAIQIFPLSDAVTIGRLSTAGAIDVTGKTAIRFDADADALALNIGTVANATNYYTLSAGETFGLNALTSIYVSGACGYVLG